MISYEQFIGFVQQTINALALGSVYALIALGYTMVYGIVRLINFAHGDVMMIGAFSGYFVLNGISNVNYSHIILAIIISMIVCAFIGIIIERSSYKPLRESNSPKITALITAIGISILIENLARVVDYIGPLPIIGKIEFIGPNPKQYIAPAYDNIDIAISGKNVIINPNTIVVLIVSVSLMVLLYLFINHTRIGKAMRAVSYDKDAAFLMGINVNWIISLTFAIGAALAAAAGILYAISYPQIEPYMGIMPGLKAFVAAVLGGIGSIPGAMFGGYIIGLTETFTKAYVSSKLADAVVYGILIIILLVKPGGIFGKNINEKV